MVEHIPFGVLAIVFRLREVLYSFFSDGQGEVDDYCIHDARIKPSNQKKTHGL
jgi:hypothetical protein